MSSTGPNRDCLANAVGSLNRSVSTSHTLARNHDETGYEPGLIRQITSHLIRTERTKNNKRNTIVPTAPAISVDITLLISDTALCISAPRRMTADVISASIKSMQGWINARRADLGRTPQASESLNLAGEPPYT